MQSQSHNAFQPTKANMYAITMCVIIALSSFVYGYSGAIIATTLTQPSFTAAMGLDKASNENSLVGAINGLYYGGGVIGAFIASWVSSRWGRKFTTVVANVVVLISAAVMTGSVNSAMFITFRFFSGIGSFMILSTIPVWIAELAPPEIRGIMVDIHVVSMMTGYAVASYVGLGFYFVRGGNAWRGPMGLSAAWPCFALAGIYWVPESPRYLISKGRNNEAWEIIRQTHANPQYDPTDQHAKREFYQIQKQIELDSVNQMSYWKMLQKPSIRRRVYMTVFLEFALMSSGVLVILNNGAIIWGGLGFETSQILNFQAGFQLDGLVFNLVAMLFVDRVKRVWLIAIGLMGCALLMMIEMILQRFYLNTENKAGLAGAASIIFIFQMTFSLFLDGATYFYVAEIWPSHLRPQGFAVGMATLCCTNMIWLLAAPTAIANISWKYFLFFVCLPAIGAVVVFFCFPDTLHKPLEEIAAMFGDEDLVAIYQQDIDGTAIEIELDDSKAKVDLIERVD